MNINWMGYYMQWNGYGRLSSRMVQALRRQGVATAPLVHDHIDCAPWMLDELGASFSNLTISSMEPMRVRAVPGRHWYLTMCEGDRLPPSMIRRIKRCRIERLIVPCEHNRKAFVASGWDGPIDVLALGTDPDEFPPRPENGSARPYTFLALADRGDRKGWHEVFDAFYEAFGGKTSGERNVRLRIKCLPGGNRQMKLLQRVKEGDPRVHYDISIVDSMADLYAEVDCVVMPSYCEGWGMPHREAAMMAKPVITLAYSGLDDGHTEEWATVVRSHKVKVPPQYGGGAGEWMAADIDDLASAMRNCFENPADARGKGESARQWLMNNQTWDHAAANLAALIRREYGVSMDSPARTEDRQNGRELHANGLHSGAQ